MPDTGDPRQQALGQRLLHQVPLLLTGLRAALAPVVLGLAMWAPSPAGFGVCITLAFVSDVFDGVIARRLNIATPSLRRLDSLADTLFYLAASVAAWWLYPQVIRDHAAALAVLGALELIRYAFDLAKFRREASYHMWSSKVWGIALFVGFFALLAGGHAGAISFAIGMGIGADLEGLAISIVLPRWRADVPSIVHAWKLRRTLR